MVYFVISNIDDLVHKQCMFTLDEFSVNGKGKGIPITGHEGPRGMWMQGSTYSQPRH